MSTISSSAELSIKFQRISTEYAKLCAQIPVLKDAVIQERAKSSSLETDLHERESRIRKLESENESLLFRNDQLLKRVETLLAEADANRKSSQKKKISKSKCEHIIQEMESQKALLEDELTHRLEENEKLHIKLSDIQADYEKELKALREQCSVLESENKELRYSDNRPHILGAHPISNEICSSSTDKTRTCSLSAAESISSKEIMMDENISVESFDVRILWTDISHCVCSFLSGFVKLLQLLEQRSVIYPNDMTIEQIPPSTIEYGRCLIENSRQFEHASELVDDFSKKHSENLEYDAVDNLDEIISAISVALQGTMKWRKLFERGIAAECSLSWCNNKLSNQNNDWRAAVDQLITILSSISFNRAGEAIDDIKRLCVGLDEISTSLLGCARSFTAKSFLENRIPTASKRLRCVNECIEKSLNFLFRCLAQCKTFAMAVSIELERTSCVSSRSLYKESLNVEDKTDGECSSVRSDTANEEDVKSLLECDPYKTSAGDSDKLNRAQSELENLKSKVLALTKEKDRLGIEVELLKFRFKELKCSDMVDLLQQDDVELVIAYYEKSLGELIEQLQYVSGRSSFYKSECESLVAKTRLVIEEKKAISYELANANEQIYRLNDELETTRLNYEDQMKNLCEHASDLNERITDQSKLITSLESRSNGVVNSKQASRILRFK